MELIKRLFGKQRALSVGDVVSQIYEYVENSNTEDSEYSYLQGMYVEDDGTPFAVLATGGKLQKLMYTVSNGVVTINSVEDVLIQFTPTTSSSQSRIMVKRSSDTESIFYGIVASAVLNRNAEIDTTSLFDYFENNYKKNSAYLTLKHLPEKPFSFGKVEGVFRYKEFLIGYGTIDTSTPLGKAAERALSSGEYGFSIGFLTDAGKLLDINGIKIRTYDIGKLVEISILKENAAANHFTKAEYKERDLMANREDAYKTLLEFLGDDKAAEELVEQADFTSRKIHENKLITRAAEENNKEDEGDKMTENTETAVTQTELVMGEEALEAIARATTTAINEKITPILETLATLVKDVQERQNAFEATRAKEDEEELNKPNDIRTRGVRPTERNIAPVDENGKPVVKLGIKDVMAEQMQKTKVK